MASVFAGGQRVNGGFRSDLLTVSVAGRDVSGFLVQNVQFSYSQQVTMLYEIGSSNVYYVGGRAQGTATLSRVAGPAQFGADFIRLYNDICNPEDISFAGRGGSCGNANVGAVRYNLIDAVLTTVSVSVTAQDVVINEQLQFIFADLDI
jgi:hypothetical protein